LNILVLEFITHACPYTLSVTALERFYPNTGATKTSNFEIVGKFWNFFTEEKSQTI
jgi:hypothetical protein